MVPDASGTLESKAVVDSGSGELNAEKTNDIGRSVSEDVEDVVSDDLFDDLEIRRWVRIAADAADDKLGQRTEAFFVGEIMAITDWFIITSGRNNRQVRAIVEAVEEALTRAGGPKPVRIEGRDTWTWVLMDFGIFVVHVFTDESRDYYDLERLWKDVPRLDVAAERPSA